jgi:hypothetical protein
MVNQIGNLSRALDQVLGPTLGNLIGLINIVIAKATEGIMVLGQMFSMNKNTTILKTAIESGDVGKSAPGRVLPGAVELLGEKRTRQLQQQSGGFGSFDSKKFTELLAQQPEIKKLLGTDKPAQTKPTANGGLTAAQQAALDSLLQGDRKTRKKGKTDAERAAEKAARDAAKLAEQTKQQLDAAYKLNALAAADLDIQMSMTKEETLQGQFDKTALERRIKFLDLQKSAKSESERQSLASAQLSEILIANNKYAKDKKDILEQQTTELYSQLEVSGVLDKTLQNRLSGAFTGRAATTGFRTDIDLDPKKAGKLREHMDKMKTDLADTQGMIVSLATTVEGSIGTAMSNAISGVIAGTATVKDAFASMFKSIGEAFIQMATQMIAKALILKVLGILGSAAGGNFGANNYSGAFEAGSSTAFNPSAFTGGMKFFADGGFVNGPTPAIVGEGGQPEYVIPASKMTAAMKKYGSGARGSAVLAGGDMGSDAAGGTATMAPSAIDVRYTVERINSVDYVTADQFQAGMRQAASQGAKQGERLALNNLRQNTATRRRVGI